jgi:mRNA-degrading endonuclease YafQ of YafQ-DinJ toxin-antitoxin module
LQLPYKANNFDDLVNKLTDLHQESTKIKYIGTFNKLFKTPSKTSKLLANFVKNAQKLSDPVIALNNSKNHDLDKRYITYLNCHSRAGGNP